jgi:tRNA nucleotidyltransferase (CCA-adding enzyme)
MHEQRGIKPLKALCARLKIPAEHQQLAEAVCREHLNVHRIDELRDATVLELLGAVMRCAGRSAWPASHCAARPTSAAGSASRTPTTRRAKRSSACTRRRCQCRQGSGYHASEGPAIGEALAKARVKAIAAAR